MNIFDQQNYTIHKKKNHNDNINQSLSKIIRRRTNKIVPIPTNHIDTLTENIIGKVASYLQQKQYCRFSTCSRSIYLGCNNPNTLCLIKIRGRINNVVYFQKFHKLKTAHIRQVTCSKYQLNKLWFSSRQLENLVIERFRKSQQCFDVTFMTQYLPTLKRLVFYDAYDYQHCYDLVEGFSNKLTFLAIDGITFSSSNLEFSNLIEFQYFHENDTIANITKILTTATNLKKQNYIWTSFRRRRDGVN